MSTDFASTVPVSSRKAMLPRQKEERERKPKRREREREVAAVRVAHLQSIP